MLKPSFSSVRAISRSFPQPQLLNARRRLNVQAQNMARTNAVRLSAAVVGGLGGVAIYQILGLGNEVHAEPPMLRHEGKEAELSVQHLQVKACLEHPGVYAWGDNSGKVIAPDLDQKIIKTPRRLAFFDDVLLRDLQIDQDVGVAVNDKGDIFQWGNGYSVGAKLPEATLKGKNIERVVTTKDKIIALSKDKTIYSFPIAKQHQEDGVKAIESSWIPGMASKSDISYGILKPQLGYLESISDIAAGRDHLLVLTSTGRLFSSAASSTYPSHGEMGIAALTYTSRPAGMPYDALQEITTLKNHKITQIATGDYHSVVLDSNGEIFTFGDNAHGQLGFEYNPETNIIDVPTVLPLNTIYPGKTTRTKVAKIAAGGMNSYFVVDITEKGRETVDVLSCGTGIYGNLGNGRWTHVQGTPTKIKALSGLVEFNEATQKTQPIRFREICVGASHAAAVMHNTTETTASSLSPSDVNYGADVLWWGNNEFYQLGTGKRNNSNTPVYIQPLEGIPIGMEHSDFTGSNSRGDGGSRASGIIGGVGNKDSGWATIGSDQVHRFQIMPEVKVVGGGDAVQTVVCGRGNTAVYMKRV